MASAFNLTAQINLRGPTNLRPIIAQIKRELGTINADVKVNVDARSAKSIDNITARLRVMNGVLTETRNHTQAVNQALGSLSSGFTALKSSSSGAATGMNQSLQTMKQTAKAVQVARTEMQEFGKQSYLAIKRFAAFSFVTTGIFALTNAITSGLKAFINFDKEMIRLQQVTGKGAIGLKGLEAEITRLATTLGVSSESLTNVATTLAQAGLNANDTRVALEALAKTELAPSFDDITQTTEGAIAALRQFELQTSDLEDALGSINSVAAAFAVESSDIITAIQRTGGVFAAASKGVSQGKDALNEFIAVFTSVRATTRESAETIATGLRTIFTRIQRARTIDQLKEFGVELTDLEGKFVGPYEAIKRLSSVLGELDPRDLRFSQIVEELGGFRQIGKVIPLIQQFATAQEALKIAQKGQGSLTEAAATAQKSLANQIAKVREQFLALVRDVGKSTVFQGLFKIVTNLASSLISLASAFKPILPILGILGAVKGASALTQFASGFFGSMNKGGGSKSVGENLGSSVTGAKEKERADATNRATEAIKANTAALNQLTSAVQSLTNKIGTSGTTTLNSGGQVRKFAGGGYVPGSGNRDTVPAMLTPGEFVIRKKAVETIGADKLHKMNKYARGGSVRSKKGSKGYDILAPIIVDADDRNIQASHVGKNLERLLPKEVEAYTSMPARRGFRSKKFDPEQTMSAGITASETFKLGLPTIANQNMKTGKPGVTSGALRDWIRKNPELLFSGRGTIPQKALQVSPQIFAETFANALGAAHPAVLFDKDLSTAFESVRGLLSPKYLESRSGKVDLFSRPAGEERSQIRHEGFDIKKISDRFLNGGFIQKFVGGGLAEIAKQKGKTLQETLLEEIIALGRIDGVKKALKVPKADRKYDSLLRLSNIKAGKNIEEAVAVIDKVLEQRRASGQVEAEAIAQATKFGLVGIQPFDYSKQFGPEDIGGRSTYITARGLSSKYSDIVQEMQAEMSGASTKFAEKIQMRNIFGGSGSLAFDFDETLVSGADIFDASGNIDIAGYNDLERVAESLKGGKLTRLGEELKSRLSQFPDLLNNIRVLTARPQSNAPLLADRLKQLGLNITENKIKGVTGPQNKINDIGELETLIDDRIKTIEALKAAGKKGIAYSPIISDLSGPAVAAGQASIEGAVLESTLAKLGAPLKPDAQPGRPIDYPDGLGNAAQYFGIDRNLPTEVKRTIDGSSLYRTRKEIERAYTENQFAAGGVAEADPAKQKIIADLQAWEQKNNIKFDSDYFESLVQKKLLEKQKPQKNFGQIALRTGDRIQATYIKNDERAGQVIADKIKSNLYSVQSSSATKGYGPKLYDVVMEAVTEKGAMLTSDRKSVSDAAKAVWSYYFSNRGDVKKTPLGPEDWTGNDRLIDPKLYGKPETWPPATDPAWILQSGYSKSPKDINDPSLVQRFAVGGEAQEIAKQMNKGTPIADSWWTGMFAGNNILFDWAMPTKAFKIPTGEEIPIDQNLRKILREKAQREWMSFQDKNRKPQKPLSEEEREKIRSMTAMSPETIANIQKEAEAKRAKAQVDRTSGINWDIEDAGLKRRTPEDYKRRFLGYANGGGVGQDTVPALLTPGEFVINKKAAKKIGYAQLHKMNKADKIQGFNKGGAVGFVQKFADGGEIQKIEEELRKLKREKATLTVKIDEKTLNKQIEDANRELQLEFAKFGGGGSGASRRGKYKASPAQSGEELIQRYVESNPGERMGGLNAKEIERFKKMSPEEAKKFSLMENVSFGGAYQTSGGMIDAGRTGRGVAVERKTTAELEKMATEDFGKKKSGLVEIEKAQQKLQELEAKKTTPQIDPKQIEDLDSKIAETQKRLDDLKNQAASVVPPTGGGGPPLLPPGGGMPPGGGGPPPLPPKVNPIVSANPPPLPNTAAQQADAESYFQYRAGKAGLSGKQYEKDLASKVVSRSKDLQTNLKSAQTEGIAEFQGMAPDIRKIKNNTSEEAARKEYTAAVQDATQKLKDINPTLNEDELEEASKALIGGLLIGEKSLNEIIDNNESLSKALKGSISAEQARAAATAELEKTEKFSAGELDKRFKTGSGAQQIKRQEFIQSEVGQKFGGLSERMPGLLESFSKTKVGKGTVKAADIFSGTNLTQGLEKRLGESGKFIGDKINALGGPMVALGGAVAIAADQITRNMTITDPNTAGAIGAVGGAGGGLASGALLGAQIAGPVGAMIAGVGGAIIGGVKGYFDAFNTKLLENNLKALDKSANELEIALKKLTIASNDATAAEVAKAAVGNQEAIKSTAQQAQLGEKTPARGWLEFFRQVPLISSVTGGGQEAEARQAVFANVERALGTFEKLGERNLARSPSSQIRDVLNEANAAEATGGKEARREVLARANQTYQMMVRPEKLGGGGLGSEEAFLAMGVNQARQRGEDPAKLLQEKEGREKLIQRGKELAAVGAEGALKQQLLAESIRETSLQAENLIDIYRRATANLERFGNELNNIKNNTMDAANAMSGRAATGPVDRTNEQILSNVSAYSQEQVNAVAEQVSGLSGDEQLGNQVKAAKILQDELPKILKNTTGQDTKDVTDQLKKVFEASKIEVPPDLFTSIEDSLREQIGGRKEVSMSDIAGETEVLEIAAKVESEALKVASDYLKRFHDALDMATEFAKNYASALDQADQMYMQAASVRLQADLKLAEALGNTTSLAEQNAPFENQVRGLSSGVIMGGSTDPNKIFGAMQEAIAERKKMQETVDQNKAAGITDDPKQKKANEDAIKALETQNIKINNANKSLELLANDGTAAANALGKIQEQQRQVEGFGNFLEKVATADFDQLVQMRKESAALVVAQNSGPEFMRNAENRQLAFAGLNAQKELYTPEEFRNKRADLLTKFYQSQGFKGEDKVPALGGMTLDEAMKRMRGGVSEDDPNVKAYREATAAQAAAADQLGNAAMLVAQEFNKGLQDVMTKVATLPDEMKKARTSAEPEPKAKPEELAKDQQLVLSPEALALAKEGIKVNTLGLDPKITGQLDTSMQNLKVAIYTLIGAMATLATAFAAYKAGGIGNLVSNVAGAVGGRRRRTGFGGDKAPRAGSKAAGDAAEKAGRKRKTDADIDAQRKRIAEGPKPRKAKPEADTSKPKQLPRRAPGAAPTTPQKQPPRRQPAGAIPSTPTPAPVKPVPTPEGVPVKPSVASKAAVAGAALEKVADAASVVDEVVGVATSATNIATGQGTVQDVVYGASDAAELAGRGGGLFNFLNKIPGVGTATKAIGGAVSSVGTKLGLGGLASSAGGALGSVGSAIGVGKPILGATGGVGAGLGNFAALNTAISAVTNAVEFMSDPAAYSARKQAQSDAGLQRAQERTGYGEFAGDSLVGALEGFTDPVGKIVEGAYVMKDAAKDVSAAREAGAKTERITQAGQKQVAESRGGGAIGKLAFDEQSKAMEEAQVRTELQAAQRVQATGGSLGDVAKIFDTSEQGLGATNLQDFIAKKESQLKTLPQDRIDSRETAKDGTLDFSSNADPKGFADAVAQEIEYRLSQIQLPPLPVKPEVKPEDQTKLGISGTAATTPEGKVAEQKTQTETSKAVDTMTSSTTTASKALEGLSAAAQSVVSALTGEKKPETVATDKKDTPAEVKSTVAAVAKTEAAVEPESCECKILKEILLEARGIRDASFVSAPNGDIQTIKSRSIDRQTTPTTSTPAQPVIPAPTPPGATPATTVQEPTTPISEAQAVSAAQTPKEVTNKTQDITQQAFVEGEDAITRAEKQYAPTAERKAFVMKELKDARQRQRIGQKLPTDDSVISASSFELKNITEAEKTKKREQYLLKKAPKFREKYMTKAEKESGLAEKLADQPQLKEEPKALNPYQQMLKGRRDSYLSEKQSRRQAYLSRFRPEVRESMMTKEEKAARDKAQTQATAQANQATTPSSTPEQTTTPAPTTPNAYDSLTPEQKESLKQGGDWSRKHRAELEQKEKEGTLTHQEGNWLRESRESDRMNEGLKQRYGGTDSGTPQNPDALRVSSPQTGPTGLPSGGPTGGSGFQIQLDPNAQSFIDNLQNTFNSFNTYIDKLATVAATIPSKIELTGNYTLDVQISGAAAFDALEGRMKELAVSLVEPKLNALRDEVSAAMGGDKVKSSASMGNKMGPKK